MVCPTCNLELVISERQGIEIDYCPGCGGIWLDRGELDKLIERAVSPASQVYGSAHGSMHRQPVGQPRYQEDRKPSHHAGREPMRESFREEIFDFD
ncbi:MAG: zf-TFIIB domain-containing protein [Syntrophobacter sp.]